MTFTFFSFSIKINSSQEDLFATDNENRNKKISYPFLVLYDKDHSNSSPFAVYPRSMFSSKEIQDRWIDSILDNFSRLKPLTLMQLGPGKFFCLFGKIDSGNSVRRNFFLTLTTIIRLRRYIRPLLNFQFCVYFVQK